MNSDRSLVRASDIGLWVFCNRAWWLARVKGVPHRYPTVLEQGTAAHAAHGAQVAHASMLQRLGLVFVGAALVLAVFLMVLWMVLQWM